MSVQFGRWNFDGQPVDPEYVAKVNELLSPYAPDGCSSHSAPGSAILYHAFYTTKESRKERQPHISSSGAVITWDGRLDNRSQLIRELGDGVIASSTDVEIVAAAYDEWGERSFAKLIGDWALAIWNSAARCLILAKDPIGTRHLYYTTEESRITWSTILDPLVLLAGHKFQLCEEYIAGWLGFFPATHLTPYLGIDSVPPSSFVRLQPGKREIKKYWDFDPHKRIRYRTDAEYEEHFRIAFGEAVRRRLRSDSPVLAELSGGMDSSSIVCMADEIIARGLAETPRLDTVSYYNDSEPNWDERPYFTKIEEKRGRQGCHIDVGATSSCAFELPSHAFTAAPGSIGSSAVSAVERVRCSVSQGDRVLLSGIGGDEFTGGVPTPSPEVNNLLVRARARTLARQLKAWALNKRKPWTYLLMEAGQMFLPLFLRRVPPQAAPPSWLDPGFVKRHQDGLAGYPARLRLFGPLPSFQESIFTIGALRRQLACFAPSSADPFERRYPYLDRSFLEFVLAVSPEQLLRPGQRRSLMRRSLAALVPEEVLNRKRKAYVIRTPAMNLCVYAESMPRGLLSAQMGIIAETRYFEALRKARSGEQIAIVPLMRGIYLEKWLQSIGDVVDSVRPAAEITWPQAGFSGRAIENSN